MDTQGPRIVEDLEAVFILLFCFEESDGDGGSDLKIYV